MYKVYTYKNMYSLPSKFKQLKELIINISSY